MEVKLGGFKKTVFEIVQIEQHTVLVKVRLRITGVPVHAHCPTDLQRRECTDGAFQQPLFLKVITATGLTPTLDGLKQRPVTQVVHDTVVAERRRIDEEGAFALGASDVAVVRLADTGQQHLEADLKQQRRNDKHPVGDEVVGLCVKQQRYISLITK